MTLAGTKTRRDEQEADGKTETTNSLSSWHESLGGRMQDGPRVAQ